MYLKKWVGLLLALILITNLQITCFANSETVIMPLSPEEEEYMNKQADKYLSAMSENEDEYTDKVTDQRYIPDQKKFVSDTPSPVRTDRDIAKEKERANLIQAYLSEAAIPWTPNQFEWLSNPDQKDSGKEPLVKDVWAFTQEQYVSKGKTQYAIINSGTIISAMLLSGLNSDLPGHLIAQVSENVYDSPSGKKLLIPQGSCLFGEYDSKVIFGQKRPLVKWMRLIYPDGSVLDLENMPGTDKAGYAGFSAKVDNHFAPMIGSAAMISVFAGLANEYGRDKTTIQLYEPKVTMGEGLPIGSLIIFGGTELPSNYLWADGTNFDTDIYGELAAVLGSDTLPNPAGDMKWIVKARETYSMGSSIGGGTTVIDENGSAIAGELAESLANMADKLLEKYIDLAPTLKVKPGYRFSVLTSKEIVLPVL